MFKSLAVRLIGRIVVLEPLEPEHVDGLRAAADDERNFVKKGVNWALRVIGERNQRLNAAAVETAERLAASPTPSSA